MTRPLGAFLALWNSISSPALQPEYETWHTMEHVPERVGLPGFIEASRYRRSPADGGPPQYFTCYWLDSLGALDSAPYREVFTHPTPWSARMRHQLRDFMRLPCTLGGAFGPSSARALCTLRWAGPAEALAPALDAALSDMVERAAVVSAQWGWVQAGGDFPIANQPGDPASAAPGREAVLLLQGLDDAMLAAAVAAFTSTLAPNGQAVADPAFFTLLSQVRQDALVPSGASTYQRQPPQTTLFHTFNPGDTP